MLNSNFYLAACDIIQRVQFMIKLFRIIDHVPALARLDITGFLANHIRSIGCFSVIRLE